MTLLASIFKTSRKRSRSDAELPPDSIHAQQWGQLPLPQQAQAQDYQSQHTLPPPRPDSGPALSRMSTMSTMSSADAGLRSRGGARLSVAVSETNFDSSSTLVDPQGGFNFPAPASIPSQSTVGLPELKREQVGGTVVRACSCACACTEYELRKHRARDRAAVIRVGVRYGFMVSGWHQPHKKGKGSELMTLQFVHTALTMASLMIALHRRDVILIGMVAGLTLAYLVYIPSAFALCLAKTASRFDHVAGEIAYLSVQIAGYLGQPSLSHLVLLIARHHQC